MYTCKSYHKEIGKPDENLGRKATGPLKWQPVAGNDVHCLFDSAFFWGIWMYCCNLSYAWFIYFSESVIYSKVYLWRTIESDGWNYPPDVFESGRCYGHKMGFSVWKKMEYLHDFSFDKTEKELNEKGVSYSNAILDGTEYWKRK